MLVCEVPHTPASAAERVSIPVVGAGTVERLWWVGWRFFSFLATSFVWNLTAWHLLDQPVLRGQEGMVWGSSRAS